MRREEKRRGEGECRRDIKCRKEKRGQHSRRDEG